MKKSAQALKSLCRFESVEKFDTLLDGDAVRKNQRFLTALLYSCGTRRKYSLGARIFFDHGAIATSFYPPQAVIGCYARQYHPCALEK